MEVSNQHRLNFTRYARMIYCQSTTVLLQAFKWLYTGKPLTLKEYCEKCPEKFKNISDLSAIKNGKTPEEMDFTLVFKLLQGVCKLADPNDKVWLQKPDCGEAITLENALHQVKTLRNASSHPDLNPFMKVTDTDLDNLSKDLRFLFENILSLSAKKAGVDKKTLNTAVSKMEDDLRKERYSDDPLTDQEFLSVINDDLAQEAAAWSEMPYAMPRLQVESSPEVSLEGIWHSSEIIPKVFPLKNLLDSASSGKPKAKGIVLVGETGAGKTSLCRYLSSDWSSNCPSIKGLLNYDLVLHLPCNTIFTSDLLYYLRMKIFPNSSALCDSVTFLDHLKRCRTLWLVDGWDEAMTDAQSLVRGLIQYVEKDWVDHTILITSTPEEVAHLLSLYEDQNSIFKVSLLGLNEEEKIELLKVHSKLDTKSIDCNDDKEFLCFIQSCDNDIKRELENPLKMLLIHQIWNENPKDITSNNLFGLYRAMKDSQAQRLERELRDGESVMRKNLKESIANWIKILAEVAFQSVHNNNGLDLNPQSIRKLKETCDPVISSWCLPTFLEYHNNRPYSEDLKCQFSFIHTSQMLFYASLHLVYTVIGSSSPENEIEKVFQQNIKSFETGYAVDQFLGSYDICQQIWLIVKAFASKLSNGTLWPRMKKICLSSVCTSIVRKVIDISNGIYSEQNSNMADMGRFYPVLVGFLDRVSSDSSLDNLPIRSIMKLVYLSLLGIPANFATYRWLKIIRICKYNEAILKEIARYVGTSEWRVGDLHLKAAWELMCYILPEKIFISITNDPHKLLDLEILLLLISKQNIDLELSLNNHLLSYSTTGASEKFLDIVCNSKSKCNLTSFSGHVSRKTIPYFSRVSHLQTLKIRTMDPEVVKSIRGFTCRMKSLKVLYLFYDLRSYPLVAKPINESGFFDRKLQIHLYFPHIQETSLTFAIIFISRFCKDYANLNIGHLGKEGLHKLISALAENKVTVKKMSMMVK